MAAYEKLDDESMKKWYSRYLMPGENVIVAAAVVYSNAGLFLNSGSFPGYLAITDGDRILCHNRDIKGENDFYFYLMNAKKIKLKRSIFGNLSIFIVFSNERKKIKLKFKTVKILVPELRQQNEKNINDLETFLKSKA